MLQVDVVVTKTGSLRKSAINNFVFYVEENKLKLTTSIIILVVLIVVPIFIFYSVQG